MFLKHLVEVRSFEFVEISTYDLFFAIFYMCGLCSDLIDIL